MADQILNPAPQVARHLEGLALLLNPLIAQTDEVEKLRREVELWKTEWSRIDREKRALEVKPKSVGPPFTAVLIDGDGLIFQEHLIQKGYQGGQLAAQTLLSAIPKLAATGAGAGLGAEVIVDSAGHLMTGDAINGSAPEPKEVDSVIVNVFINKLGLGNALIKAGLVRSYADYDKFWQGFSAAHELFIVCDVGQGKEASDAKIREYLRLYAKNAQCEMIVLGASHDNGYATVLSSLQTESRLSKLLLLKGYSDLAYQLKQYSSRVVSIPDLFRTEKVPNVPMSFAAAAVNNKKPDGSTKTCSKAAFDPPINKKDATKGIAPETIATKKSSKIVLDPELIPVTTKKKSSKTVALIPDMVPLDMEPAPTKTKKKVGKSLATDNTSGAIVKQLDTPPTPSISKDSFTTSAAGPESVPLAKQMKAAKSLITDDSSSVLAMQSSPLISSKSFTESASIPVIKKKKAVKGSASENSAGQLDVLQEPINKAVDTALNSAEESDSTLMKIKKKSKKTISTDTEMAPSIIFKQSDAAPKPLISSKSIAQSSPCLAPLVVKKNLTPDSDTLFEADTDNSYETETDSLDSFIGEVYQWGSDEPTSRAKKSERNKEKVAKVIEKVEEEEDDWMETPTKKKKRKEDKDTQTQMKIQKKAADRIRKLDPRPCHAHYLSQKCKMGKKCTYGHDYDLTDAEVEELAKLAKSNPCPQAWNNKCRLSSDECILGHKCLLGPNCSFGESCRFFDMPGAHE